MPKLKKKTKQKQKEVSKEVSYMLLHSVHALTARAPLCIKPFAWRWLGGTNPPQHHVVKDGDVDW